MSNTCTSNIHNEPKIKNKLIQAVRGQLEQRAAWLYLLCDEAGKRGLAWEDFGSEAIRRCGLSQGGVRQGGTSSLKGLRKQLFTKPAQWVFEMKIRKSTEKELAIDFHYCPLVKAWQKAGCSDQEIRKLCDIAMCGDHGIGEAYGGRLKLLKSIAKGDDVCRLYYHKK
nr:L-2-amino-thiazoline-4-carboxylic acid hydrolase [uncultured Blautia sp.]